MTAPRRESTPPSARTVWAPTSTTPLRDFLRTETGSAIVLLAATLAALVWANAAPSTYEQFWHTPCPSPPQAPASPRTCASGSTPA